MPLFAGNVFDLGDIYYQGRLNSFEKTASKDEKSQTSRPAVQINLTTFCVYTLRTKLKLVIIMLHCPNQVSTDL